MIESLGKRLRLVMSGPAEAPPAVDAAAPPTLPPLVEFIAYQEDCIVAGEVRLDADRLSDLLNHHEEFQLVNVRVEDLAGERAHLVNEVVVARDELLLVHAIGPRGERSRRVRTRQHPLALKVGPYEVRGYLHALPGVDPIMSFRHRLPMVPLTDASIEYDDGSSRHGRQLATVLVNRQLIDWVVEAMDDEPEIRELPVSPKKGRLVKDFTPYVTAGPTAE